MEKLKNILRYAKISYIPFNQRSLIHREAWFPSCFVRHNEQKANFFYAAILDHFSTKMFNSETTSFQHFSLKEVGGGGKKGLKIYYMKRGQTHKQQQTDGHCDY